jgi:hypothetical protein
MKKRPVRKLKHRWKNNIKLNLREISYEDGNWFLTAHYTECNGSVVSTPAFSGFPQSLHENARIVPYISS